MLMSSSITDFGKLLNTIDPKYIHYVLAAHILAQSILTLRDGVDDKRDPKMMMSDDIDQFCKDLNEHVTSHISFSICYTNAKSKHMIPIIEEYKVVKETIYRILPMTMTDEILDTCSTDVYLVI